MFFTQQKKKMFIIGLIIQKSLYQEKKGKEKQDKSLEVGFSGLSYF